jgi:hypothetical protein
MIIDGYGAYIYEVTLAILEPAAGNTTDLKRYFSTSEQLLSYLKNRPNVHFSLLAVQKGARLTADTSSLAYRPEFGDITCGEVYFSTKDSVVYSKEDLRKWGG